MQITENDRQYMNGLPPAGDTPLTVDEYADINYEIEDQPAWRAVADKEMDYADGNQLDTDLLRRQQALGIPPAVEDLIGPALLSLQGYEAVTRTDWRVTPNGDVGGQDVADALNYRLNTAERQSGADRACSEAFRPQIACGIGWVEVSRESDPFKFPYRCRPIRRDEIHWDMKCGDDWEACRFLRRQRWLSPDRIALVFPEHAELIGMVGKYGSTWWGQPDLGMMEGGTSTGLHNAWSEARAWTVQEDRWYNPSSKEICLVELWYRRWVQVHVLKSPDGRVVEYDPNNLAHNIALASGRISPKKVTVTVVPDSSRADSVRQAALNAASTPYRGSPNGQLTARQIDNLFRLQQSDDRNATSLASTRANNDTALAREQVQQQGANQRAALQEMGQGARFLASNELDRQRLAGEQEARGFQTRAAQRIEKLYEQYDKAAPEDRAAIAEQIRVLAGKDAPNRFTVVPGGQEYDPQAMQLLTRPARVLNNQTGQFIDQQGQPAAAAGGIPQPKTAAEYEALPKGTQYMKDGQLRVKG